MESTPSQNNSDIVLDVPLSSVNLADVRKDYNNMLNIRETPVKYTRDGVSSDFLTPKRELKIQYPVEYF